MSNIKVIYLYRDGDNYKNGGSVVIGNPGAMAAKEAERAMRSACDDGNYFIAHQVGLPELFSWDPEADYDPDDESTYPPGLGPGKYVINDADHSWHELSAVEASDDPPTLNLTLDTLLKRFASAARRGWLEFQPGKERPYPGPLEQDPRPRQKRPSFGL